MADDADDPLALRWYDTVTAFGIFAAILVFVPPPLIYWAAEHYCIPGRCGELKLTDGLLALFTYWLVVVTAGLIWTAQRQEKYLRRSWKAARAAATAATEQAKAMEREFRSARRPRIRIKHVWLDGNIEPGIPVRVQLVTVNTGSLPAHITKFDVVTFVMPRFRHPPNDPFRGRRGYSVANVLKSGQSLDHESQIVGDVTLHDGVEIQKETSVLYCFAYVDYTDGSENSPIMKTSCCRQLRPDHSADGAAHASFKGSFINGLESAQSEHNYAD
jgi:hypothetical protein